MGDWGEKGNDSKAGLEKCKPGAAASPGIHAGLRGDIGGPLSSVGADRQKNLDGGLAGPALETDGAAEALDEAQGNAEAKAEGVALVFGGEKRLKDF